ILHVSHYLLSQPRRRFHLFEFPYQLHRLPEVLQDGTAPRTRGKVFAHEALLIGRDRALEIGRNNFLNVPARRHKSPSRPLRPFFKASLALKSLDLTVPSGMLRISRISS